MKRKLISALLAGVMGTSVLAGCGGAPAASSSAAAPAASAAPASSAASEAAPAAAQEFSYPMKDGATLTYWMELNGNVAANFASMADTPFAKALMEQTGVTLEYQHPAAGQTQEQFNLILADGNLPDIMQTSWINYPGGPQKAIDDGYILALNDVFDQYCPNIKAYLAANPDIDKMIKTDDGNYYCFPFIRGDKSLAVSVGAMVRGDLLEQVGKEVPTTMDEWYDVLTTFKNELNMTAPFTMEYATMPSLTAVNPFMLAYEAESGFYVANDGTIKFGPVEDNYKEYLTTFAKWYKEGLIDADIASVGLDQVSTKITNNSAGASVGWNGGRLGTWTNAGRETNENFSLVPARTPVLTKGAKPERGQIDTFYVAAGGGNAAITTSCENVEAAARLLDYGYGEAGHMLFNFGIEGTSYTMNGDYPAYTDEVLKNPNGLSIAHALSSYVLATSHGPFVQDKRYVEQYYALDEQKEALKLWSDNNAAKYKVPTITPTTEESTDFSTIMTEVNTYVTEMSLKFILGTESLDNWDTYVATIEKMNLARAVEIQNAALARFKER